MLKRTLILSSLLLSGTVLANDYREHNEHKKSTPVTVTNLPDVMQVEVTNPSLPLTIDTSEPLPVTITPGATVPVSVTQPLSITGTVSVSNLPSSSGPVAWEYTKVYGATIGGINNLGAQGWELIQVYDTQSAQGIAFIFKRQK